LKRRGEPNPANKFFASRGALERALARKFRETAKAVRAKQAVCPRNNQKTCGFHGAGS